MFKFFVNQSCLIIIKIFVLILTKKNFLKVIYLSKKIKYMNNLIIVETL